MTEYSDRRAAGDALGDPTLPAAALMEIARDHANLRVDVAGHPNVYPELLVWLDRVGNQAVRDAVAERRRRDAHTAAATTAPRAASAAPSLADAPTVPAGSPPGASARRVDSPPPRRPAAPAATGGLPRRAATRLNYWLRRGGRPSRRRRLVIGAVALVVVLVLGVAFGVPSIRQRLLGHAAPENAAQPGLVVENPPNLTPRFADGYTEAWRFSGLDQGKPRVELTTADAVVVSLTYDTPNTSGPAFLRLDPKNGEVLWHAGDNTVGDRGCDPVPWANLAVCWILSQVGWPMALDLATGQEVDLGLDAYFGSGGTPVTFFSSGGALYTVFAESGAVEAGSPLRLVRWTAPQQVGWSTTWPLPAGTGPSDNGGSQQVGDLVIVHVNGTSQVFDAGDGHLVAGEEDCPAPALFAGNHITCAPGAQPPTPRTVTLSSGSTATLTPVAGSPLPFGPAPPPATVLAQTADQRLIAVEPTSGAEQWSLPLPQSVAGAAWDRDHRLVVAGPDSTSLIDLATGQYLWRASFAMPADAAQVVPVSFLDHDSVALPGDGAAGRQSAVLDAATGHVAYSTGLSLAAGPPGPPPTPVTPAATPDALFATHMADTAHSDYVARVSPALTSGQATVPAGFPACPTGLAPVAWTQYPDGLGLVCGAEGQGFSVVARRGAVDLKPTHLTFTPSGWTVACDDGTTVTVTLGGGGVTVASPAGSTTHVAQGWQRATGVIDFSATGPITSCPAGTVPQSLSTWDGGWLLLCGGAGKPSWAAWSDATAGAGQTTTLTGQSGGSFCADDGQLTLCAHQSPALVVVTPHGGDPTQHSVGANWFDGLGPGGTGRGTGSYGVPAPQNTAADQVRYLVDLLNRSAQTRGKLGPAVAATTQCQDVAGQVAAMTSIAQNRQDLLTALAAAPVDLISGGTALVEQLRTALQASLDSDNSYLAWARQVQQSNCAEGAGSGLYQAATSHDQQASTAKAAFVATWNATIAPAYGVTTFSDSQI